MKLYVGLVFVWLLAAWSFIDTYYAIRHPEKYIRARWTTMRGLPRERSSASFGGAISALQGVFFFGCGLVILHYILTNNDAPLPPLP